PTIPNYTSTRVATQDPQVHKCNQRKDTMIEFFPLFRDEVLKSTSGSSLKRP
uniref:Uncharacterized protein n=1 Tax=Triticum urartu TaxID=4572 RepID=A0A8R7PEM9_TRIUA